MISQPLYNGTYYLSYKAMFQGTTATGHAYRVPCEIVAPGVGEPRSGVLVFDWVNISAAFTAIGRDFEAGRYMMTDKFLFDQGHVYATVRCDPNAIGLPWADGQLPTAGEFIQFEGDEPYIVADFNRALKTDNLALSITGPMTTRIAFGFSSSGMRLRGLLRTHLGFGLFDASIPLGAGIFVDKPAGSSLSSETSTTAPSVFSGLEMDINTEAEVLWADATQVRLNTGNMRTYEIAGGSHARRPEAILAGLASAKTANPADWFPMLRALFVASVNWANGGTPPQSIWMGAPGNSVITRDGKGNALITHVGGSPTNTTGFRLPEVAVAKVRYIALDPAFSLGGDLLEFLRAILGTFAPVRFGLSQQEYVDQIAFHAKTLVLQGYLLKADAIEINSKAEQDLYNYAP